MTQLIDMHCHLDFFSDPVVVARQAEELDMVLFGVSCSPYDYLALRQILPKSCPVRLGVGFHPWWLSQGRLDDVALTKTCEFISQSRYVGEIGLDFSLKHVKEESFSFQEEAFTKICEACAHTGDKVLSIHAVSSVNRVLDIAENAGATQNCSLIFHWFSGSNDELWRAIKAGAWFSVNAMMLRTKRAKEYVKVIPPEKLILETDWPPENPDSSYNAQSLADELNATAELLSLWLGRDIVHETTENACALLDF